MPKVSSQGSTCWKKLVERTSPRTGLEASRVYLRPAVRLLPTGGGLRLHSAVEVRDVLRRVEASWVVVLVRDDPSGSAGSR